MEKGKNLCPHCGKENNEDNIYCGYTTRSFSELMKSVTWNKLKYGNFMVRDFFTEGESVIIETPIVNIIKNCKG